MTRTGNSKSNTRNELRDPKVTNCMPIKAKRLGPFQNRGAQGIIPVRAL